MSMDDALVERTCWLVLRRRSREDADGELVAVRATLESAVEEARAVAGQEALVVEPIPGDALTLQQCATGDVVSVVEHTAWEVVS
jgi:hypothetical protein